MSKNWNQIGSTSINRPSQPVKTRIGPVQPVLSFDFFFFFANTINIVIELKIVILFYCLRILNFNFINIRCENSHKMF